MAAQYYKINYKSDFVLTINSDAGWAVPFCIKFWTGMPSHGYFAGFDGEKYVNCRVGDEPTQLLVMFDDHHMPIGPLRMQIAYHTTIEEFPDRKFDEVTNPTNVTVDIDGTEYQVMLDFTGETGAEIDFSMPSSGVMSVNGKIGYVTLNAEDVGAQPTIEDLATIRSGAAAGETAVQPSTLQEGLATKQNVIDDLATIRSGATAGATAVQPAALTPIENDIDAIEGKIPSAASASNQLADKAFVNSALSGKADTSDIPTALSQLSQDSTHRVVTDAEKSTWNGKQNTIDDLATIRSGAAAGATAVQPAALTPIENDIDAIEGKIPSAASTSNQLADKAFVNSALADKADTSDIPTALSQLSQDSTHRVVTDAEKSTWNGKQNAIDDLSTIRSGAAAGATAVQPAAMNTALAAKQDTLTFDNAPTANSNNPVKSSGIKTALDAKQSTISTVNVSVDNNTGTPSGSASVSGSTLSLSFQNLKGATGATGATGPQGPQGERGLPGESGVTGDVSGFTVRQTIDPSATYGATDIAGAATVQATNQELTELEGNVDGLSDSLEKAATVYRDSGYDDADLSIADENGYVVAKLANGHIQTKNFDSADVAANTEDLTNVKNRVSNVKITETNGVYVTDLLGNVGASVDNNGVIDALGLGNNLRAAVQKTSDVDYKQRLTFNRLCDEISQLRANKTLQSVQKSGTHRSFNINIPSVDHDRENVIVRLGLHYGNVLSGRTAQWNDVYFEGDCETDFSDVRIKDSNGNILDKKTIHCGNYEVYRDSTTPKGYAIAVDSQGVMYTSNRGIVRSLDGGRTWESIANNKNNVTYIMMIDSRGYLFYNCRDTDSSHTATYGKSPFVYMLNLNNSFDQNDEVLVCDMTYAGWQDTDEEVAADPTLTVQGGGVQELGGYIFFGRYQQNFNAIIYRSINSDMTPDSNGDYFKIVYSQEYIEDAGGNQDYSVNDQHVHNIYVHVPTNQVFAGLDNSLNPTRHGPRNIVSDDYGETWHQWDISDNDVWIMQSARDYIPQYISTDGTWMLGGGEANILGGATTCKIANNLENGIIIPSGIKQVVRTAQGSRQMAAFNDNWIIQGLCAGSGISATAHLLKSEDEGETWQSIYEQQGTVPTVDAGNGVRYFTKPFVPRGETESVIYATGFGNDIDTLRIVKGGNHHYGEVYVNVGYIAANESKTLIVEDGYANKQTDINVLSRDIIEPVYSIALNEGYGNVVIDSNGNSHSIVGGYKWDNFNNNVRFGSSWPVLQNITDCNGLLLDNDAYIELGKIPQLNFNKGFSIAFWYKLSECLYDFDTNSYYNTRYNEDQIILSNTELMFSKYRAGFRFGTLTNCTRSQSKGERNHFMVYVPVVVTISNDSLPVLRYQSGEEDQVVATVTPSSWPFSNLSELSLRIGCQSYISGRTATIQRYLSDIRIYDKVLSYEDIRSLYYGYSK